MFTESTDELVRQILCQRTSTGTDFNTLISSCVKQIVLISRPHPDHHWVEMKYLSSHTARGRGGRWSWVEWVREGCGGAGGGGGGEGWGGDVALTAINLQQYNKPKSFSGFKATSRCTGYWQERVALTRHPGRFRSAQTSLHTSLSLVSLALGSCELWSVVGVPCLFNQTPR